MRKWIGFLCVWAIISVLPLAGQQQNLNVELSGRWAKGRCETVFRRGEFTFIGNGRYIEVYRNRRGIYTKLDDLLLPGAVKDIWVKGDLSTVYVACGEAGLRILRFDPATSTFLGVIGVYDTPGYAHGVMQIGSNAYIADGNRGLAIVDIEDPYTPRSKGSYQTDGFARRVWVVNDSTVLIAADLAGLYSVKTKNPAQPVFLDSLVFSTAFPGFNIPAPRALSMIVIDTVAYVATGWGGMRTVSIKNPNRLRTMGVWTYGVPVEVRSVWVSGNFAHLACGPDGFFSPINISNPNNPTGPNFLPVKTGGFTSAVVTYLDTAFVADGFNGHLLIDIQPGTQPFLTDSVETADYTYDALLSGNTAFLASGKSGLKVMDLDILNLERMEEAVTYQTKGEARALKKVNSYLYVADGKYGLTILNAADPLQPTFVGEYVTEGDTCYDVDVSGSYALLACGRDGIRAVDVSGSIFEIPGSPFNTRGKTKAIQISRNKAYVADSTAVYVYDVSRLPSSMALIDSLPSQGIILQAIGLDVVGDSVFVANGSGGFLLWNRITKTVTQVRTTGRVNDLVVREKTLFIAGEDGGLRIFDFSIPGSFNEVGYYNTEGKTLKVALAATGGRVCAADGDGGMVVLESSIYPRIVISPATLNFGPVPPDYVRPMALWIMNSGTTLLKVTDIKCNLSTFKFAKTSFTVAPGDTFSLGVRFEPKTSTYPFLQIASAVIYSSDPSTPTAALTLQGEVTALVTEGPYDVDQMTVGLYHFDEANGATTVTDVSGNGFHGQVHGVPQREDATRPGYGRQIFFDKQNDWVGIPFNPAFNFYNSPFTVELWFNMTTKPQNAYLLMGRGNGTARQFELALYNGSQGLMGSVWDKDNIQQSLSAGSVDAFRTNQWYHTALTFNGDTLRLYLNGVLKGKKALRKALRFQATEPIVIGASSIPDALFHGAIDEVRISSIARESWEFHVNRSRLDLNATRIDFGKVLTGYARRLPLTVTNSGSQPLVVSSLSTTNTHITVSPSTGFSLTTGQSKTLYVTFRPVSEEVLGQGSQLLIESSDPTYPIYNMPLGGSGINAIPAGPYKTDAFTLGLWHFDEASGTTAYDSSGYGMNGTLSNGAFFDSQKRKFEPGRSAHFDGVDDLCWMKPPQGVSIGPKWGGMTLEGWFTLEAIPLGRQMLIRRGRDTAGLQFELYVDSTASVIGKFFNTQKQAFFVSSKSMGNIQRLIWYHVAMVLNADSLIFYINGNKTDAKFTSGQIVGAQAGTSADTLSVLVGRDWEGTRRLLGNMDEIRISSVARQPWEFNVNLARIVVSDSLQFGTVLIGKERMRKLWVKNTGIDKLYIDETTQNNPAIFKMDTTRFTVNPGDSQLVRITFKPLVAAPQSARITFRTNDPFLPNKSVYFAGTGIQSPSYDPYRTDPFTLVLYHFNEKSDTLKAVADSSRNRIQGTLEGSWARMDTARFDRAVQFVSGRVKVPTQPKLNLKSSEFTVEFWFQMQEKPKSRVLLFKLGNLDTSQVELSLGSTDNAGLTARVWNSQSVMDTLNAGTLVSMNANQWYHAALSWDGDSLRLYLNARLKRSKSYRGNLRHVALPALSLGADEKRTLPFRGKMDEFRLSQIARKDWEFSVVPPQISIYPQELNFAAVLVNQSRVFNFGIQNQGDQDLKVTGITGGTGLFLIPDTSKSFTLSRNKSILIPVTYTPTVANRVDNAVLIVTSNDPVRASVQVQLTGSGTEMKEPTAYKTDAHTLALYHFDQLKQDTVLDASGRRHHGLIKFDVRLVSEGFFGSALQFDGTDGRIEVPSDSDLVFDYQKESFTIECFFKTDTVAQALIYKGFADTTHAVDYGLMLDKDGRLYVEGLASGGPRYADGSWHHVAFTYSHFTKTGKVYLDGNQIASKILSVSGAKKHDRPLVFGAAERQVKSFFRYFQGTLDEVRISDIAREPWEFQWLDYGIRITSVKPDPLEMEKTATFQFNVPSSLQTTRVVLYYRSGGGTTYAQINADRVNATTYRVTLPSAAVTLEGLEYYVEVTASNKIITYPLLDPRNNPFAKPVKHSGMTTPVTFQNKQFQMFSIPFKLDSTDVPHVLGDDFGAYDPHQWRLFWWHRVDTTYISYTDTTSYTPGGLNIFDFLPGRAYWITTYLDRTFDIGRGQTVTTDSGFVMPIPSGWNMIGNPFNFEVKWGDCTVGSDSLSTLYYYRTEDGYHVDYPVLEPWKGYWIHNADTLTANLVILPRKKSTAKTSEKGKKVLASMSSGEWLFKFSAEADRIRDNENYAGVRQGAKDTWDPWDRPEPPAVDNRIQLSFENSLWTRHAGTYAVDIRPAGKEGYIWDFFIETSLENKTVNLSWNAISNLPEGWQAFLLDLEEGNSVNTLSEKMKSYKTGKAVPNARKFRWIVGTPEFLQSQNEGIPLEPVEFHLYQNYPNPFNPETTIYYSLPRNGETEILVFNMLGQRLRTLVKQTEKTGRHEVVWDGKDDYGRTVPSGVYLLRLKTPDCMAVRKMTLMR